MKWDQQRPSGNIFDKREEVPDTLKVLRRRGMQAYNNYPHDDIRAFDIPYEYSVTRPDADRYNEVTWNQGVRDAQTMNEEISDDYTEEGPRLDASENRFHTPSDEEMLDQIARAMGGSLGGPNFRRAPLRRPGRKRFN